MLKTYEDWVKSQQDLENFLGEIPCEIDEDIYYDQLGALPPLYHDKGFQYHNIFQVGEAYTSIDGISQIMTFTESNNRFFYLGILPEFQNLNNNNMNKIFMSKTGYKVAELTHAEAIERFVGTSLIDDYSGNSIPLISDKSYYIPVLNYLVSKKSFLEWDSTAKYYGSDIKYQDRNVDFYLKGIEFDENYYPDVTV